MTPTPNAAALAWADADPAGAVQAICTADSLRALRLQYVAMRRTWPATTNGRTREAVRSAIVVIRMAVRALGGGARLATPGAFKLSIRAGDGTALNLAAEPIYIVERSGMGAGIYASVHADGLPAMLAAVAVNVEGLSALAFLHRHSSPARTVEPFRPVKRASLARLHHAPARDAAHLPGFDLLPAAQSAQGTLPGFEPFTSGVPSWLLSMFDQAGASSSQRGRKGAPWSMRLWVYPLLMVKVAERDGRTVRLPTRLGDIERWIWPDGWDRSNRAKHWPAFRDRLIGLGTIRPRIIGPDGLAYLVETVRAPVVPERWDPDAICPIFVSIPRSAASGAAVDWPALIRYGADSPGMFRAHLATVAVLDYTAREGHGITREIAAPVLRPDGKPKRRKGGLIVRDPSRLMPNPAARYVGRLTDEDLRRMIGLPNHHEYRARARGYMERLHKDGVIDLERLPDGRVRIFAPGRVRILKPRPVVG